jgi:hypothetical protein
MKIRSLVASAAAVAMGAGVLFAAAPAHAAGDTAVTFTLTGGTLSIDVADAAVDLGSLTPDAVQSTVAGNLSDTTVTDNRNSLAGWTTYAYSTAFARTGGGATDIPAANVNIAIPLESTVSANLRGGALDPTQIGTIFVGNAVGVTGDAEHGTGVSGGQIGALSGGSLSTLLGTDFGGLLGGTSNSTLTYTPQVTVTVPADQAAGEYTGTVYQTVS